MFIARLIQTTLTLLATILIVVALSPRDGRAQSITYVDGFDALPVMTGMAQTSGSLIFDTPAGRILQAQLVGDVRLDASVDFYRATLRSLGWTPRSPKADNRMVFTRDDEALAVQWAETTAGDLGITFELNPAPAP
ncbi:MAG: hypothetical protein AAF213_10880 [Pseudomonadota bacterium]